MILLARFILQQPGRAALVTATMAMLGLLFAPAFWVSAAAIALVTLVKDYKQGLIVMAYATAGSVVLAAVILTSPLVAVYFVLVVWLPAWLTATVLRITVALSSSLLALTGLCLVVVVGLHGLFPDIGELLRQPLETFIQQLAQTQNQLKLEALQQFVEVIIKLMPGLVASTILTGTMLGLSLARWWQAVLYNPGGFGKEFQGLNLGRTASIGAAGIILAALLLHIDVFNSMLLVVVVLYLAQGMSIVHAVAKLRKLNVIWLYLVYALMFLLPEFMVIVFIVGIVDAWIDFRGRFKVA